MPVVFSGTGCGSLRTRMLLVLWIGHSFEEQVEARNAADVFRRGAVEARFGYLLRAFKDF